MLYPHTPPPFVFCRGFLADFSKYFSCSGNKSAHETSENSHSSSTTRLQISTTAAKPIRKQQQITQARAHSGQQQCDQQGKHSALLVDLVAWLTENEPEALADFIGDRAPETHLPEIAD